MSRQINEEMKSYYDMLECVSCQTDVDITEWLVWYLDCMARVINASDEVLSRILQKATFWQNHAHVAFTERQNKVLNIYLDGYTDKLTVKNWAKHCKVSVNTASRDIKKDILEPQPGRMRDVFYGIRCDDTTLLIPEPLAEEDDE